MKSFFQIAENSRGVGSKGASLYCAAALLSLGALGSTGGCVEQRRAPSPGEQRASSAGKSTTQGRKRAQRRGTTAFPKGLSPGKLARLVPDVEPYELSQKRAEGLIKLSLSCVSQPYPYKPSHVIGSRKEVVSPKELHPAFYGCFDWHSAVHGHWAMVRFLRQFPKSPSAIKVSEALDRHLTKAAIRGELAYFQKKHHQLFERPYGWAWFLRLAAELHRHPHPSAAAWREAVRPLERYLAKRTQGYLKKLSVPVREGTHSSTAFALSHIYDYAEVSGDATLRQAVSHAARRFYSKDTDCPVSYEPSGEDFISPCLAEADLMRRVLNESEFLRWWKGFFRPPTKRAWKAVLKPPRIHDPKDPRIGHLIGLSLHRAWTYLGVAQALPKRQGQGWRELFKRTAALHRAHALSLLFRSGYGGSHWLASFALYLLTHVGREPMAPKALRATPRKHDPRRETQKNRIEKLKKRDEA